jgi:4-amino-4-deoxy-L-arabinose transferase-like glycosyltransferase
LSKIARRFGMFGAGRETAQRRWLLAALVLFLLLRIPSWFEPHWYTDEAGYANTAYLAAHGRVLYLTVWNNKPPLLFWIYDIALSWFGPSELGLHLLSTLAGGLTLAAVWQMVRREWGGRGMGRTMVVATLLLGLPLLSAELALPENFLIFPEAAGMLMLLRSFSERGRWRAVLELGAGTAFGLACLIQQTAVGPLLAMVFLVALMPRAGSVRGAMRVLMAGAIVTGAGIAPYLFWAGPSHVYYFLVTSFEGYTSRTLPLNLLTLLPRGLAGALLVLGVVAARKRDPRTVLIWTWLGVDLLTYVLPNRPYPFHLLPAAVPLALVVGRLPRPSLATLRLSFAPLVAGALLSAALWGQLMVTYLPIDDFYTAGRTVLYYPMFVGRATGVVSKASYQDFYDYRVRAEAEAGSWIRAHGLTGARTVVWSADSWAYLLVPVRSLMPAPPIYKDFDWLGPAGLIQRTVRERPELILVTNDAVNSYGPLQPILTRLYTKVETSSDGSLWLLNSDLRQVGVSRGVGATPPTSPG